VGAKPSSYPCYSLVLINSVYLYTDMPVTGHGGPWGCKRLRLPRYLDKRLIVVASTISIVTASIDLQILYNVTLCVYVSRYLAVNVPAVDTIQLRNETRKG
jgi:hypothetical protein